MAWQLRRIACTLQVANATIQEVAKATWIRKGARSDESAAGPGRACNLPGVSGAWLEAHRLPYGSGALGGQ